MLYHRPIDKLLAKQVIRTARSIHQDTLVSVEVLDHWYTDRVSPEYQTEVSKQFEPDRLGPVDTWLTQDVTKILLLGPGEQIKNIRARATELFAGQVAMTQDQTHLLQIMSRGVSKGAALKLVCKRYDVALQKTIAIGDAPNDIDMLKISGIGIAMASAPERVRRSADYVTSPNDDEGVAEALERFVL
ncbi:unnamed protein product [marine sediment metagenome]|uniref:Uncharacterized protein n=1 Tax=marine sediment metagenome TaxID=412755 RepID=X0ZDS4_9ZZZZ